MHAATCPDVDGDREQFGTRFSDLPLMGTRSPLDTHTAVFRYCNSDCEHWERTAVVLGGSANGIIIFHGQQVRSHGF